MASHVHTLIYFTIDLFTNYLHLLSMGVLSEFAGVLSITTTWNTANARRTVTLREIFSPEPGVVQNTISATIERKNDGSITLMI